MTIQVYKFDPLDDPRWNHFVNAHPCSSIFHTVPWLKALRRTYRYEPVVYTTSPPGEDLKDAVVLCRVESWITGRRLVSLPFSDHCQPLAVDADSVDAILAAVALECRQLSWKYVEVRPRHMLRPGIADFATVETYCHHDLDLTPPLETLFHNFHKDCVQRKIRRAVKEGLVCKEGRTTQLLNDFYRLMLVTRHRHQVPPQPRKWFANLMEFLGDSLSIQVAYNADVPLAAIMTLTHNRTLTYKFGCSDAKFHKLGAMQFLFWHAIQDGKQRGFRIFDFGRSELINEGLIAFKDRWGAERTSLPYYTFLNSKPYAAKIHFGRTSWSMRLAREVFGHMPGQVLAAMGNLFYRHIG
jgi:CelD/BcsL family acetyltransferase involved in cellulose biosynthesis